MSVNKNIIAIGRSRYLYDSIIYLVSKGFSFKAIITEEAYDEYDVKEQDFKLLAESMETSFFLTRKLNTPEIIDIVEKQKVRAAISANWRVMIPPDFIDLFECGILNFHLGSLPDYKGNAVVNWTILNGENYINATIHKLDKEMDAGDIICRKSISITDETYVGDILKHGIQYAPALYEEALEKLFIDASSYEIKGTIHGLRCYPRLPEDSQIDWNADVEYIGRLIRASSHPFNGAYTFLNNEKIIIWKAGVITPQDKFLGVPGHVVKILKDVKKILIACPGGLLEVEEIEYNGKVMPPTDLIKSIRLRFKYLANGAS